MIAYKLCTVRKRVRCFEPSSLVDPFCEVAFGIEILSHSEHGIKPIVVRNAHRNEIKVLAVLKASTEMSKPGAPRDALQNDLLLEDERKVALLQDTLPDGFQCVKSPVLQMLDEEDSTLCSRADKLVHSKVCRAETRSRWRCEDSRGGCELEIGDGELPRRWRKPWSFVRTAINERRRPGYSPRMVLIST